MTLPVCEITTAVFQIMSLSSLSKMGEIITMSLALAYWKNESHTELILKYTNARRSAFFKTCLVDRFEECSFIMMKLHF